MLAWTNVVVPILTPDTVPYRGLAGLFDLYRARVQAFSEVAPPADWNGVFVAETK